MTITLQQRQKAWSLLTDAPSRARAIADKARADIQALEAEDRYTAEYKAQQVRERRDQLNEDLAEVVAETRQARETLAVAAREMTQGQGDTSAQLLAETRRGRAWDRVRPQLEAGRSHQEIVKEAIARGDADTVLAMRAEMPAYLEAQRQRPGGMDNRLLGELDLSGLTRRLDIAAAKILGDDKGPGTAATLRLHAEAQHDLVTATVDHVRGLRPPLETAINVGVAQKAVESIQEQLAEPAAA